MANTAYGLNNVNHVNQLVDQNFRRLFDAHQDVVSAITTLNSKIASVSSSSASSSSSTTVQTVTTTNVVASGGVNNQTGTSYTTLTSDAGAIITLNNPASISVTLDSTLPANFFCSIQNIGAGVATLTPNTGTVNGASSISLITNQGCSVYTDGTNWWANATQNTAEIQGVAVSATAPTDGQGLVYSASQRMWLPKSLASLPSGGTAGQVLTKNSSTDYDAGWATPCSSSSSSAFVGFGRLAYHPCPITMQYCSAAPISATKMLVGNAWTGSAPLTTCYIYDRTADSWTLTGSLPVAMRCPHSFCVVGAYVYAVGMDSSGADHLMRYSISAGTWTEMTAPPSAVAACGQQTLILLTAGTYAGKILCLCAAASALYVYDQSANSWSTVSATIPLTSAVLAAATMLGNNNILWCGQNTTSNAYVLNQTTMAFTQVASTPYQAWEHNLVTTANGNALMIGSYSSSGNTQRVAYYDYALNAWTDLGSITRFQRANSAVAVWPADSMLFMSAGQNSKGTEIWQI